MFRRPGGKITKLEAYEQDLNSFIKIEKKGVGLNPKEEFARNVLEMKESQME